jgi:hypothetical protein
MSLLYHISHVEGEILALLGVEKREEVVSPSLNDSRFMALESALAVSKLSLI